MKALELRTKEVNELKEELISLCKEQFNLRMQKRMGQASKAHLFKQVRKSIARIKTVLCEKGIRI